MYDNSKKHAAPLLKIRKKRTTIEKDKIYIQNFHFCQQVVFTKNPAAMTWQYPQPRTLTRVSVFPVPFKSASESGFDFGDDREVGQFRFCRPGVVMDWVGNF